MKQILLLLLTGILLWHCEDSTTTSTRALPNLPEAQVVDSTQVPDSGQNTFYLVNQMGEYEKTLQTVIAAGVPVLEAWIPLNTSPCLCATCTEAMVVVVSGGESTLVNLGFVSDVSPWVINCGVEFFDHYTF